MARYICIARTFFGTQAITLLPKFYPPPLVQKELFHNVDLQYNRFYHVITLFVLLILLIYPIIELRSVNGKLDVTLFVRSVTVTSEMFSYNTRAFCVDSQCSVPGPTLYCLPGDEVTIYMLLAI